MKGHDDIIELLNDVLTAELTAINQYFVDAKMCQNWGYERLAQALPRRVDRRDEGRRQADRADPVPRRRAEPAAPRHRPRRRDAGREVAARPRPRARGDRPPQPPASPAASSWATTAPASCSKRSSSARRSHADWLETQLELVRQVGEAHYLAQQIHEVPAALARSRREGGRRRHCGGRITVDGKGKLRYQLFERVLDAQRAADENAPDSSPVASSSRPSW